MATKVCSVCGEEKDESLFGKTGRRCKKCRKIYDAQWRANHREGVRKSSKRYSDAHPDRVRTSGKKHREKNKEKRKAKKLEWYNANRDEILVRKRAKYQEHKEEHAVYGKTYRATHKEEHRVWARRYQNEHREETRAHKRASERKRRARRRKVKERYTRADEAFTFELFNHECFNCHTAEDLTIDHINPLFDGYGLSRHNACVLCRSCNASKKIKPAKEFYSKAKFQELMALLESAKEPKGDGYG